MIFNRLPIDVCTNSYSTRYQGTYSEKYICNEKGDAINATVFWGHECLGRTVINEILFDLKTQTECYNYTYTFQEWCDWYGDTSDGCPNKTTTESPSWNWNSTNHEWNISFPSGTTVYDNRTVVMQECYNWTWSGYIEFNCDQSLPECPFMNYTYLEPLPEQRECTKEKSEANWHTQNHVVQQCVCHESDYYYEDNDYWNRIDLEQNETFCSNYLCDEEGLWFVEYNFVDITKPTTEWCLSSMDQVNDAIDGDGNETDINAALYYSAGCDKGSEYFMEVGYCPGDDAIMQYSMNMLYIITLQALCYIYY